MAKDRLHRLVREAQDDAQLVRIRRSRRWDILDGVVVAHGPKWLLLAVEFDAGFYGHSVIRIRDITDFADQPPNFVPQALAGEGHWPMPNLDQIDVSGSTNTLAHSLMDLDRPLAFHHEARDPRSLLIGLPLRNDGRTVRLRTVDTHARWDSDLSKIRYRDLTRVDIDDPYVQRLQRIAGSHPPSPIGVSADIRLRQFDPWQADDHHLKELLVCYRDIETVRMVDGPAAKPYKLGKLKAMYQYMSDHGELYLIERLSVDGNWRTIGDAALQPDAIPIVIAPQHRNQGIGRAVAKALIKRARELGWRSVHVSDIYDYNVPSRRLYESLGFVVVGKTKHGHRYKLTLS